MKKYNIFYYIFIISVIITSCSNEEMESEQQKETSVATRTLSTSLAPGAIKQIADQGIPIYIKNGNGQYLGINANKNNVFIYNTDDPRGKQEWQVGHIIAIPELDSPNYEDHYLYLYTISTVKDNKALINDDPRNTTTKTNVACVTPSNPNSLSSWEFDYVPENNCYRIIEYFKENGADKSPYMYLSKIATNQVGLNINENNGNQLWRIQPVDTYTLENLSWRVDPEDIITTLPDFIQEATLRNYSSTTQTMTATYAKTASESSSFSETKGTSITVSASVGVPFLSDSKIETSTTTSQTWQYGSSQNQQDQRSYSFPLAVPPHTTLVSKVMVQMNKLTATYIATYRGSTGTILKLEGKWEGVQAGNIYYEIRELSTNTVLKKMSNIPKSTVTLSNN